MKIFINGEIKEIARETSLSALLEQFSMPSTRIAVELNEQVVRRKDWDQIKINDADKIEVIHFVGGG